MSLERITVDPIDKVPPSNVEGMVDATALINAYTNKAPGMPMESYGQPRTNLWGRVVVPLEVYSRLVVQHNDIGYSVLANQIGRVANWMFGFTDLAVLSVVYIRGLDGDWDFEFTFNHATLSCTVNTKPYKSQAGAITLKSLVDQGIL